MEQVGECVEGVAGVLGVLKAQEEHLGEELKGVRNACEAVFCVQEGGVVGRLLHRPLAVGVQEVVPEDVNLRALGRHPPGHRHKVPGVVVRGEVQFDGGVVRGASPVFSSAYLHLAILQTTWPQTFFGGASTSVSMSATSGMGIGMGANDPDETRLVDV